MYCVPSPSVDMPIILPPFFCLTVTSACASDAETRQIIRNAAVHEAFIRPSKVD